MTHKDTCFCCEQRIAPKRPAAGTVCKPCRSAIEKDAAQQLGTTPKRKKSA
jgi:hypothetical protein